MKKNNIDLQDIYRADEKLPEESAPAFKMSEMVEKEIRRQQIFGLVVGLASFILIGVLISALVSNYVFVPEEVVPKGGAAPYVAAYTLPKDELWAIEYRQAAAQADSSKKSPGQRSLSTKWVKNAAYHIIMGEQALRQGDEAVAQSHFESAQATFPEITGLHRPLGEIYLKQKDPEKAVEELQKALEKNPSVDVLNNLGVAYVELGKYKQAETFLRQALQQDPGLAGTQKNLALLYQKAGRTNETVVAFEKYFRLNPKDTPLLTSYVAYLTKAGQARKAIAFLEGINGADPQAVQLMLAKTAAKNNDTDLAVRSLREASRFLTPRQTIAEMHGDAFEPISKTEPFEKLMDKMELAAVTLSTNAATTGTEP